MKFAKPGRFTPPVVVKTGDELKYISGFQTQIYIRHLNGFRTYTVNGRSWFAEDRQDGTTLLIPTSTDLYYYTKVKFLSRREVLPYILMRLSQYAINHSRIPMHYLNTGGYLYSFPAVEVDSKHTTYTRYRDDFVAYVYEFELSCGDDIELTTTSVVS